jgi:myo-inositol-1(or 4)-monophosphatase
MTDTISYEKICVQIRELCMDVGQFIREEATHFKKSSVEYKGTADMVSYVDKTAEKKIVEKLSIILPEAGFLTEEKTSNKKGAKYSWIIDPLDGTTNFIHGIPCYCISIALAEGNEIIAGVIYEINQDECFYAWKNSPAFMNDKIIEVSSAAQLNESLFATGFAYYRYEKMQAYMKVFDELLRNSHGIRRLGSAAADMAYVACGRLEGFYEYGLNPWDVAAGIIIVKQAGGVVTDFSGGTDFLFGKEIVASGKEIFKPFSQLILTHLGKEE